MGITFKPGDASWSYAGFNRFRELLAKEEGIDLDHMVGFGGTKRWDAPNGAPVTVLAPLLNHSDCDGYIGPEDCASVWPRLATILDRWATRTDRLASEILYYDIKQGRRLVRAMQHCAECGCALVFQ